MKNKNNTQIIANTEHTEQYYKHVNNNEKSY